MDLGEVADVLIKTFSERMMMVKYLIYENYLFGVLKDRKMVCVSQGLVGDILFGCVGLNKNKKILFLYYL